MSAETTPAIKQAAQGIDDATNTSGELWLDEAQMALAAALPTECHEAVVPEWADGEEVPCNSTRVVGFRSDDEGLYPVCAEHVREPMAPLRTALLGADS
jgi:hypothetical protein